MKLRFSNQVVAGSLGVIVVVVMSLCGCRWSRSADKISSDRCFNRGNRYLSDVGINVISDTSECSLSSTSSSSSWGSLSNSGSLSSSGSLASSSRASSFSDSAIKSFSDSYERSVPYRSCGGRFISNIGNNLVRAPREENRAKASDSGTLSSLRPITYFSSLPSQVSEAKGDTSTYALSSERGFQSPFAAPFSTFSLDVDTSSYGVMRRMLNETGLTPVKQSVRIEEYVNSFKYGYPDPQGACPISLACEMGSCPWNDTNKLLRVGVQAKRIDNKNRHPCNLVFLVDVSGSMRGEDRLELIKYGLHKLVANLKEGDRVSIVTYAEECDVVFPSTRYGANSEVFEYEIERAIDGLAAHGCTNGGKGIQLAYREAEREFDEKANNRVVLLTDGDFNVGVENPDDLEKLISNKRDSGVFLSVLGVGTGNYGDARMKRLANYGNGNYAFLGDRRDAERFFVEELEETLFTVAKDVKLQLEFNPAHVAGYRLLGYGCRKLGDRDFGDDQKDAGELTSGKSMTAFYEIVPAREPRAPESGTKYQRLQLVPSEELMSVKLRYKLPNESKSREREFAYSEKDIRPKIASADFVFASAVAEYALLLSESPYKGSASFDSVIVRAKSAKGVDADCSRAEFVLLAQKAKAFVESK